VLTVIMAVIGENLMTSF